MNLETGGYFGQLFFNSVCNLQVILSYFLQSLLPYQGRSLGVEVDYNWVNGCHRLQVSRLSGRGTELTSNCSILAK